ncbi:MAG: penicillin-binding protein 1C [Marinilabiliales bacterium]|nr:MAG: penicillin-binding protein 1C [Marinilabiliales bacterium]
MDFLTKSAFFSVYRLILVFTIPILLIRFLIADAFFPLEIDIEYSTIITSNDSTVVHAYLTSDDKWRMYTELSEINDKLKKAIINKEDKWFYYHPGVNFLSVTRAAFNNLIKGQRTSGASTITMQVARLLNPKSRTYLNKTKEIFMALQLELHYSKDEILQMYLNLVPYGGNIEGVKSASVLYFKKAPSQLSLAEVITLSIIPNRPTSLRLGGNNQRLTRERNKWINRFRHDQIFNTNDLDDALNEKISTFRQPAPSGIPHLSRRLKTQYSNSAIIRTHIDMQVQSEIEKLVKTYIGALYFQNIKNACVLVVKNDNREVISYVGSADFNNPDDGGQVDGTLAVRSPGSTLKPLLYGMAMDKGLITPKFKITDTPVSFNGYEPENYDGNFNGKVSIEYALANSLNIVAVKVLDKLGVKPFVERLIKAGFKRIKHDRKHLGLSTVLGGCGASLEELTGLYCALAHEGEYSRLSYVYGDSSKTEKRILSKQASYMITEILTQLTRPDLPLEWQNSSNLPKVAWKTGTSYGRRDAWSIGYNKNYTVGVWVGNFSGHGVPDLSGAQTAAPLLFNIFNVIDYKSKKQWYTMPDSLDIRYVCSESGLVPNEFCKNQVMDYFIPFVSTNRECTHMRYVWISPDSSISYCSECLPESGYIKALYPNYEKEMISYYEMNGIRYQKIPDHNPDCERIFTENEPKITSPINNTEYYINETDSMQVLLSAHFAPDVSKAYWYINNTFYKSGSPTDRIFFSPTEGKVTISCSDDKGRFTSVSIDVKEIAF